MRLSHMLAVAAVAGMAMFGAQSPASAGQAGAAFAPAASKLAVSNDLINVGRRGHHGHRHGYRHRKHYGHRSHRHRYGHRRGYKRGGPSISLRFGSSRRGHRHY